MVPLQGERDLLFQTDKFPCEVTVQDSNRALLRDFRFMENGGRVPGSPELGNLVPKTQLPPNATIRFTVIGRSEGFTGLKFLERANDIELSVDLTLSIKRTKPVTFCFAFLADLVRKNVRGLIEPRFLMDAVKKVFSNQANVDLQEFGHMRDITVLRDLGNPIQASDDAVLDAIEDATSAETFASVSFIVYCCWNIERKRGTSDTRGLAIDRIKNNRRYAFIEVANTKAAEQSHALAHEIGHVLGLTHTKDNGLMFPTTATQSNRLFAGDIEVVNSPPDSN